MRGVRTVVVRALGTVLVALVPAWTGEPAQAASRPDKLEILAALERRDYATLDKRFTELQQNADRDVRAEADVELAFETFAVARPELEPLFRQWVKQNPKSYVAQLALATHYLRRGWHARGSKFANETSSEQFAQMNFLFAQAIEGASAAIALHPTMTTAYSLLINVAMAHGENQREVEIGSRALEKVPASYCVRRTLMQTLRPRWGGSYPSMQKFAEESQSYVKQNPRLRELLGMVAYDMATVAVNDKNYGAAVALFSRC